MNYVTINTRAAAQALDFVVGPEVRVGVERLYELLNNAEKAAHQEGFKEGFQSAGNLNNDEKREAWSEGYDSGYEQAEADADENDESYGFYDASEMDEKAEEDEVVVETTADGFDRWIGTDECQCEQCSVEREEALPPMQQQGLSPFAWSPGPVQASRDREDRFND